MKKVTLITLLLITSFTLANTNLATLNNSNSGIQIIRLDYNAPNGASRELVLAFTSDNAATDGVDYGYDAAVYAPFSNDLNWLIDSNRYVIQGVGEFQNTSQYLFGLYSEVSGEASITLSSLENFNTTINVYIFDALLNTYTNINDTPFVSTIDAGDYTDRFYIAFMEPEVVIDTEDVTDVTIDSFDASGTNDEIFTPTLVLPKKKLKLSYFENSNRLNLSFDTEASIKSITIYNYKGNTVQSIQSINNNKIDIPLNTLDKNLIIHIKTETETETIVKQIVLTTI
ncbi:hypothetical protein [Olleya marilimosa]|uniref:hypothetical protein n=1 Tax=Olleya marilimosa TaxID=272164 RepID=UPI00168D9454|nr:hypothetical protein [Olleya marilimosa]MBD3890868.1 hypothetical protein [Olleya marilimosa]